MGSTSRRTFLKFAAMAAPSVTSFGSLAAWGKAPATLSMRPVQAWRTSDKQRCERVEAPAWRSGSATGSSVIRLNPEERYQGVLGFGAALTDASCYLLAQMPGSARATLLKECFGADGLGLSIGRTTIGSSDYSRDAYTYDDSSQPDPDLAALQHRA